jgi:hypothetical protein
MSLSSFPGGFNTGLSVRGMPLTQTFATSFGPTQQANTGVWWVDSVNGSGTIGSYTQPVASLARALQLAKTNDVIVLKPGHTETISTATATAGAWNVTGLQIIGLGTGARRPTITLDTATTATINVSAASISVSNVIFVANFLNIASLFTLTTAKDFVVDSCLIKDTSSVLNFVNIVTTSATSNANDGLTLNNNKITLLHTTAVNKLVSALGTHDSVTISNNIYTAATTDTGAVIPIAAGKVLTNSNVLNNIFSLQQTTGVTTGILITTNGTTNSGMIAGNFIQGLDATSEILVTASSGFLFSQNYYSGAADKSGYLLPAADA